MINIQGAERPRQGAWRAFVAYDTSLDRASSDAWCCAVYLPSDRNSWSGNSKPDQPHQTIDETRAVIAREVLHYCDSKTTESNQVDLYIEAEADTQRFADLAGDWPELDVELRLISHAENPARILRHTNNAERLNWL